MEKNQKTRQMIRNYLSVRLKAKNDIKSFGDATLLVSSGRLDSLDVIETVIFLEEKFGLNFSKIGFDQSYVDSVDAIVELISPITIYNE